MKMKDQSFRTQDLEEQDLKFKVYFVSNELFKNEKRNLSLPKGINELRDINYID